MFFVLHANLCGQSMLSHHGHTHGNSHVHLHESIHHHSHSRDELIVDVNDEQETHQLSSSSKNINVRAAIIHVIGDFVQSIGVLFAAILIKIKVSNNNKKKKKKQTNKRKRRTMSINRFQ
jgi:solute carrier family 30 (zinc transporter), member 2